MSYVSDRLYRKMPPDLQSDPVIRTLIDSQSAELLRLWEAFIKWQGNAFVPTADDDGLVVWERMLSLPVDPVGVTIDDRRNRVRAQLTTRFQFYGKDLRAGVEQIGGPIVETTVDLANGLVTFELTGAASQFAIDQVEAYLIEVGPAHIQWIIISPSGSSAFIAGISQAGDAL